MTKDRLQEAIQARGREFFAAIGGAKPSVFDKSTWTGKVMAWCMENEPFKAQLFRFVDVMPTLTTAESLDRHLEEYFSSDLNVPAAFRWGIKGAALGGVGSKAIGRVIRSNVEAMARQFILGGDVPEAIENLSRLRQDGFAATVDILGEATVGDEEAAAYVENYLRLLDGMGQAKASWPALGGGPTLDWGCAPPINISIKPSAMDARADPMDFDGSTGRILDRARRIYRKVIELGGFLCIDMESRRFKNLTLEVFRRLRSDEEFRHWPHLGVAIQAYLVETDRDVDGLLDWSRRMKLPISIRLVKGAYWDFETAHARQNNWPSPVYTVKAATDTAFERLAEKILRNHALCHLGCGTHNVRTVSSVMETARALGVPEDRYEFQVLYGMAEPFRNALLKIGRRVRLYCPQGRLLPGMAYLIRRLLENSSNESFLRQTFIQQVDADRLLEDPQAVFDKIKAAEKPVVSEPTTAADELPPFRNEPAVDFTQAEARDAYRAALAKVHKELGRTYPLSIGGKEVRTGDLWDSLNPARSDEVVGRICQAGPGEIDAAIAAAQKAFEGWRDTPAHQRAEYLLKAAEIARSRFHELAAWQTVEVGKQWNQACGDVAEAIDYLEYYAREMLRLGGPHPSEILPGERNELVSQPKGIAAVIAPWNFPLAISCGMASAAIVAGNCILYKPSEYSPVCGHLLAEIFQKARLPDGVFNYIPGRREAIGDYLAERPQIGLIAFTGSMQVGLHIIEKAARTAPGQSVVKKVIAEMGGKNAILVDDDADLDEAVPAIVESAFGYQGQKCSACSRLIVLESIYEPLVRRLLDAVRSLPVGPPDDPGNFLGPLVSRAAQEKTLRYIKIAAQEGTILYSGDAPPGGWYAPITIVTDVQPQHRIAQEEIFGPVLAIMKAKDFDQGLQWANSTPLALTGAVFSRSPQRLEQCRREFRVGNLYLNRPCTGAMVRRQPFGGLGLSGVGAKAGGGDYLLQFLDAQTVSENTIRRGFAPDVST